MFAFVVRRFVPVFSSRLGSPLLLPLTLTRMSSPSIRPSSLSLIRHSFSNMQQMMDEISKNPKALALLEAIKKNPKIIHAVQDLMTTMNRKGYIDLNNPTRQPNLAMLADSEVRNKLFELVKLLATAGVFNAKDGANPMNALSNVMGLLMPPPSKDKKNEVKNNSTPKYDFTYDATKKDKTVQATSDTIVQGWTDKLKKMFK
ncbi:unnamed protein product [Rotaria socialis]|uniref:Uncharacterized protein n=4 Tax=Rotaria socialis TaxID=392032 RepID=A0A818C1A3_9BILA|nr:unnamed protein product [Rotaria socialis]CAF3510799.1 unnamed protein product [Rotaria socialis]CAF4417323.1 unnamed protein product [Rotaria socialis]